MYIESRVFQQHWNSWSGKNLWHYHHSNIWFLPNEILFHLENWRIIELTMYEKLSFLSKYVKDIIMTNQRAKQPNIIWHDSFRYRQHRPIPFGPQFFTVSLLRQATRLLNTCIFVIPITISLYSRQGNYYKIIETSLSHRIESPAWGNLHRAMYCILCVVAVQWRTINYAVMGN